MVQLLELAEKRPLQILGDLNHNRDYLLNKLNKLRGVHCIGSELISLITAAFSGSLGANLELLLIS